MPNILKRRGVPKKKEYLLYDNFTVVRAAGTVNSTPADITARIRPIADMTRTVVDTYATTEMVLNPGFETAGAGGADIWANWTENAGTGTLSDETTLVHSGSHAMKNVQGASFDCYAYQIITVIPGMTYTLTFWTRGDGTNDGRYRLHDNTNGVSFVNVKHTGVTGTTYAQVSETFTVPVGCVSIVIYFQNSAVNGAIAYFDDVSLLPTTGLVSIGQTDPYFITELITNGGFEKAGAGGADIWSGWIESAGNGALANETSIVHTGGSAAKITAGASANTTIQNPLTGIIPGQQYTLTFWTRGDGTNDGRYQVYDFSNSATIVQGSTGVTGTTYTQVTVNFTAPTGCVIVQIWFKSPLANGGIAYFDDVSVKPVQSSGKLWFAGGMSVAAQGQPALYFPAITRKAGQVVKTTINQPSATELFFGLDADTTGSAVNEALDFNATNLSALSNTTSTVVVGTYSYGKDYQVAMVCRATGMFFFIKGGAFTNWTLLRVSNVGNTATLYPYFVGKNSALVADDIILPATLFAVRALASDSFTRGNGAIGSTDGLATAEGGGAGLAWDGSTWTISSNKALNTPTLSITELVTNGTFDSDISGWTNSSDAGGTIAWNASGSMDLVNTTGVARARQVLTTVVGTWYQFSYTNTGIMEARIGTSAGGAQVYFNEINNVSISAAFRATATTSHLQVGKSAAGTANVDSISFKAITLSSLFASLTLSTTNVILRAKIFTQATRTVRGVVARLDSTSSPANFIICYFDGQGVVKFEECVSGTYAALATAVSKAFTADDTLVLHLNGSAWRCYHVTAAGVESLLASGSTNVTTGVLHGLFGNGDSFSSFECHATGTEGQYTGLDTL